jgi:hypothetical protein
MLTSNADHANAPIDADIVGLCGIASRVDDRI